MKIDITKLKKTEATQKQIEAWQRLGYTYMQIIGTLLSLVESTQEPTQTKVKINKTQAEIKKLRSMGMSYQKIADELGISRQTVYNHLKK